MGFFHAHTHSEFSCLDAVSKVGDLVETTARFGMPGLALTDHGLMSGTVQLYKGAKQHGIAPFPGVEAYLVKSAADKDAERFHVTLLALNYEGYQSLVRLVSLSHTRERYHYKPRIDFTDLARLSESGESANLALLTGCYFGLLQQTLARTGSTKRARAVAKTFATWFPHTFIEVQHHDIQRQSEEVALHCGEGSADDAMTLALAEVARDTGIPTIVTYDSHYLEAKDKPAHDMMKRLIIRDVEPSEAGFPGSTYHYATAAWVRRHYKRAGLLDVWDEAQGAYDTLLDLNQMSIPVLDKYRFFVPRNRTTMMEMEDDCYLTLQAKVEHGEVPKSKHGAYKTRLAEELAIIKERKFHGYLLHVRDYVGWLREKGYLCLARGSASSSLVCWLLGITHLDPVKWDLLFERFISPDRTTPPDIDIDVEDVARDELIEHLRQTYDVVQIGSFSSLGVREEDQRGSLVAMYMGYVKRQYPDADITTMEDAKAHNEADHAALWHLDSLGARKSPGAHAAGFVVTTRKHRIEDLVPTMLIPSSDRTVTQYTMDDVETMGFIKDDVLGLRNLTTVHRCLDLLNRDPLDLSWIPLNDNETFKTLRSGNTEGIFQFEGWSNSKVARLMKVKHIRDVIAATSLGRPAVLKDGYTDEYIRRRKARGEGVTYPSAHFERHLKGTFGIIVFQEQVLSILADLGMDTITRNRLLKAVKSSNNNTAKAVAAFTDAEREYHRLATDAGMSEAEAREGWDMLAGFAGYGFNKAHATAYGILGYQTAYLKTHHPLEYMTALLETVAGDKKEPKYVTEARRMGLRLLGPSVNDSAVFWTLDRKRGAIRKGLLSIKGVGRAAAEDIVANAPYTDLQDLVDRTGNRTVTGGKDLKNLNGVMVKLQTAGALTCLGVGRSGW